MKCTHCDYTATKEKWTRLEVGSVSGHSWLLCYPYDVVNNKKLAIGKIDLYSCPYCRTITWGE